MIGVECCPIFDTSFCWTTRIGYFTSGDHTHQRCGMSSVGNTLPHHLHHSYCCTSIYNSSAQSGSGTRDSEAEEVAETRLSLLTQPDFSCPSGNHDECLWSLNVEGL